MSDTIEDMLRVYLGPNAGDAVMKGTLGRGQSISITAAILIADIRGSTPLIERLGSGAYIDKLNSVYDVIVPQITRFGGEVLQFTGDGLLAVFEETPEAKAQGKVCPIAVGQAYKATMAASITCRERTPEWSMGFGLSYGAVDYADVGTAERRSLTVIGAQVNRADRLQRLCPIGGANVALSERFAAHLVNHETRSIGCHSLKGFSNKEEVFVPVASDVVRV